MAGTYEKSLWGASLAVVLAGGFSGCTKDAPRPQQASVLAHGPAQHNRATDDRHTMAARIAPQAPTADPQTPLDMLMGQAAQDAPDAGVCPPNMALVDNYCIDKYEAGLVEILPNGEERPWSPYISIEGHVVRAITQKGIVPQAYISEQQAKLACSRSAKRLCKPTEWKKACMGPAKSTYGYGATNEARRCNDHGRAPMMAVFGLGGGSNPHLWGARMNDSRLNQVTGTVAKSGDHEGCTNDYGVYDMVGNLHEWVDDPEGTFQGGFYLDVHELGDGCNYRTSAHAVWYHDYSTGFRCCANAEP